jgi:hypothetical protein
MPQNYDKKNEWRAKGYAKLVASLRSYSKPIQSVGDLRAFQAQYKHVTEKVRRRLAREATFLCTLMPLCRCATMSRCIRG